MNGVRLSEDSHSLSVSGHSLSVEWDLLSVSGHSMSVSVSGLSEYRPKRHMIKHFSEPDGALLLLLLLASNNYLCKQGNQRWQIPRPATFQCLATFPPLK